MPLDVKSNRWDQSPRDFSHEQVAQDGGGPVYLVSDSNGVYQCMINEDGEFECADEILKL